MRPESEPFRKLARFILATHPDEITCDEWLDRVGAYAEAMLAGQPIPPALEQVRRHMEMCPECAEEFEALLDALRAVD